MAHIHKKLEEVHKKIGEVKGRLEEHQKAYKALGCHETANAQKAECKELREKIDSHKAELARLHKHKEHLHKQKSAAHAALRNHFSFFTLFRNYWQKQIKCNSKNNFDTNLILSI